MDDFDKNCVPFQVLHIKTKDKRWCVGENDKGYLHKVPGWPFIGASGPPAYILKKPYWVRIEGVKMSNVNSFDTENLTVKCIESHAYVLPNPILYKEDYLIIPDNYDEGPFIQYMDKNMVPNAKTTGYHRFDKERIEISKNDEKKEYVVIWRYSGKVKVFTNL